MGFKACLCALMLIPLIAIPSVFYTVLFVPAIYFSADQSAITLIRTTDNICHVKSGNFLINNHDSYRSCICDAVLSSSAEAGGSAVRGALTDCEKVILFFEAFRRVDGLAARLGVQRRGVFGLPRRGFFG